jgi:drug/metabolite transporter (DMT)-like permease
MAGIVGGTSSGIALRLLATLFFSLMSLSVRLASVEAPVGQIVFWRSAVALVPILVYLALRGQLRHGLRTERPLGHVKRSLYGCAAMFFSFLSIAHLPLALATALSFLLRSSSYRSPSRRWASGRVGSSAARPVSAFLASR